MRIRAAEGRRETPRHRNISAVLDAQAATTSWAPTLTPHMAYLDVPMGERVPSAANKADGARQRAVGGLGSAPVAALTTGYGRHTGTGGRGGLAGRGVDAGIAAAESDESAPSPLDRRSEARPLTKLPPPPALRRRDLDDVDERRSVLAVEDETDKARRSGIDIDEVDAASWLRSSSGFIQVGSLPKSFDNDVDGEMDSPSAAPKCEMMNLRG